VLEDAGGQRVTGYRAPSFSIDARTPWAHEVLAEQGYAYSSSVAPIVHDHYGWREAPRFAFRPVAGADLIEIPVTTAEVAGRRMAAGGGGFFRLLPYTVSRWAIRQVNSVDGRPAVFYFHPWEIDPEQPRVASAPLRSKVRHYTNLAVMAAKLDRLIRDFRWGRMDEVAAGQMAWLCRRTRTGEGGMNAPFRFLAARVRLADPGDRPAMARFLAEDPAATAFHRLEWIDAVERATGHRAHLLLAERDGAITAMLPLHAAHSPLFGRALVSTGFAVGGGLIGDAGEATALFDAARELARRLSTPTIELRGGLMPEGAGWHIKQDSHAGFVLPLAADDEAQLLAVRASSARKCARDWATIWKCGSAGPGRIARCTTRSMPNPCATWARRYSQAAVRCGHGWVRRGCGYPDGAAPGQAGRQRAQPVPSRRGHALLGRRRVRGARAARQ
jgi:hypothetical protein